MSSSSSWNKELLDSVTEWCNRIDASVPSMFLGKESLCVNMGFSYCLEIREKDSCLLLGAHPSDFGGEEYKAMNCKTRVMDIVKNIERLKDAIGDAGVESLRKGKEFDEISTMFKRVIENESKQLEMISTQEASILQALKCNLSEDQRKETISMLETVDNCTPSLLR